MDDDDDIWDDEVVSVWIHMPYDGCERYSTCTLDGQRVGLRSREIDNFWKRFAGWVFCFLYCMQRMNGMEALPAPSVVS